MPDGVLRNIFLKMVKTSPKKMQSFSLVEHDFVILLGLVF